jgi:hypothetical protein
MILDRLKRIWELGSEETEIVPEPQPVLVIKTVKPEKEAPVVFVPRVANDPIKQLINESNNE